MEVPMDVERWMREALALARAAGDRGEVPVGAVAVLEDRIVGRGENARESSHDPTAHAELLAIQDAARALGRWRLTGVTLFVTLEPCAMCAGAMVLARVERVVFGARDPKAGACVSLYQLCSDPRLNHRVNITEGVLADDCAALLQVFFATQRAKGKK